MPLPLSGVSCWTKQVRDPEVRTKRLLPEPCEQAKNLTMEDPQLSIGADVPVLSQSLWRGDIEIRAGEDT